MKRTFTEGDRIVRAGIVEDLSTRPVITGSFVFDTTLRLGRTDEEIDEKARLLIDGVDTA